MKSYSFGTAICLLSLFIGACSNSTKQEIPPEIWYSQNYRSVKSLKNDYKKHGSVGASTQSFSASGAGTPTNYDSYGYAQNTTAQGTQQSGSTQGTQQSGSTQGQGTQQSGSTQQENNQDQSSSNLEIFTYKRLKKAFELRNFNEFQHFKKIFLSSFPNSGKKSDIQLLEKKFFYKETLKKSKFDHSLVEIRFPKAKTFSELKAYFKKLRQLKVGTIQLNITQYLGEPVFQFAGRKSNTGFYFKNHNAPVVDDILKKIVKAAHEEKLKLFVSFPIRKHFWIGEATEHLMDERWDPVWKRTMPIRFLDLFNPSAKKYLEGLLTSLVGYNIDGIIFKNDFTYKPTEGFSKAARWHYQKTTGKELYPQDFFFLSKSSRSVNVTVNILREFEEVAKWRAQQIHILLNELITKIKQLDGNLKVGVEFIPEMMMDQKVALASYSVGLAHLVNLNADFFILDWKKSRNERATDYLTYHDAAIRFKSYLGKKSSLLVKAPINQITRNVIRFNELAEKISLIKEKIHSPKLVIGPIDRTRKLALSK
ncbi:MAG: hypothetical protein ACI86H_002765 [bacterium]|jgi:hypothetical protein